MFISKNYIFIHIPRTAGTSIQKLLRENLKEDRQSLKWLLYKVNLNTKEYKFSTNNIPEQNKLNLYKKSDIEHFKYSDIIRNHRKIENRFFFSCVRNPWDWHVSIFEYFSKNISDIFDNGFKIRTFEDYINWLETYNYPNKPSNIFLKHFHRNQIDYLKDWKGKIKVNKILKFENINKEIKNIDENLILNGKFQVINKSDRKYYREYFDSYMEKFIEKRHKKDIELFKYKF